MTQDPPSRHSDEKTISRLLEEADVPHEVVDVGDFARTAEEAARNLRVPLAAIVKSLVCVAGGVAVVAMVPGDRNLSFDKLDRRLGTTGAKLAGRRVVERATGYVVGGVAPVGLPTEVPLFGDASILHLETIFCGAGSLRHMLRISPRDLTELAGVEWLEICA